MDRETIERVEVLLKRIIEENEMDVEKIFVFGSRARDDYKDYSDVDLLIVSEEFEGVSWNRRPSLFYDEWDYNQLPTPEFICLTPEEFKEKRNRKPHIVKKATEEGIEIA